MPHAKIATKQATLTLEQLHAELGGRIIDNKADAKRLAQAMKHVEAVLKMLNPEYNVRGISIRRRKPNPWFRRGTVFRNAVDALRRGGKPMTGREIVQEMLQAKGVTYANEQGIRALWGGVQSSFRNHKGKTIERVPGVLPATWRLLA